MSSHSDNSLQLYRKHGHHKKQSRDCIVPGPRGYPGHNGKSGKCCTRGQCGPRGHRGSRAEFYYDLYATEICERVSGLFGDGKIIVEVDGCLYKATSSQVASCISRELSS